MDFTPSTIKHPLKLKIKKKSEKYELFKYASIATTNKTGYDPSSQLAVE